MANRELYMDHVRQNFWKESVQKEAMVRREWHLKYSKEFVDRPPGRRPRREGMVPKPISALPLLVRKHEQETATAKNLATSTPDLPKLGETDQAMKSKMLGSSMRPPTTGTRQVLYKGLSHEGEGRFAYLSRRKLTRPEERYEFPITTTFEYGWEISDATRQVKPSPFARGAIVRDTFYRDTGIGL